MVILPTYWQNLEKALQTPQNGNKKCGGFAESLRANHHIVAVLRLHARKGWVIYKKMIDFLINHFKEFSIFKFVKFSIVACLYGGAKPRPCINI